MSWRTFRTLLGGVVAMPNSAVVNVNAGKKSGGTAPARGQKVITIDMDNDPKGAQAFFASMTGRRPKGKRKKP